MDNITDPILNTLNQLVVAQIGQVLNVENKLVNEIINHVINRKVDSDTGTSHSGRSYDRISYLEWVVRGELSAAVRVSVQNWVKDKSQEIQSEVIKILDAQKGEFTEMLSKNLLKALNTEFSVHCKVDVAQRKADELFDEYKIKHDSNQRML